MCGLYLFAPLEGVAQKFTVFCKSLSCTLLRVDLFYVFHDFEKTKKAQSINGWTVLSHVWFYAF